MPLLKGKKNIGKNIKTEEAAGKPHDVAVAIALNTANVPKKKSAKKKSKRGKSNGKKAKSNRR